MHGFATRYPPSAIGAGRTSSEGCHEARSSLGCPPLRPDRAAHLFPQRARDERAAAGPALVGGAAVPPPPLRKWLKYAAEARRDPPPLVLDDEPPPPLQSSGF